TLFDDYEGRTSAASKQAMSIAQHLYLHYDLKAPLADSSGNRWIDSYPERLRERMTPAQQSAWDAAYGPKNAAFLEANLEGADLVRWKYQRYIKDYLRSVASVDDQFGRLMAYLKESGLDKNTIVIYSSDQGFFLGDHGWYDKRWMYEESLRMPLIVRWPGVVTPGSVNTDLVQNLDFAETLLDLAGVSIPASMQGRSFKPLLTGETPADWREAIYYHYYESPSEHVVPRHEGVRTDRFKLIHYYELGEWEMFDLERDPNELHSLYANPYYAKVRNLLHVRLDALREQYGVPDPAP
ncbi:MAG TPA: sulfatase/phosphatase domain-containing protein, partial [Rhodothermales bacterium]|nr:sulfatase/phosphatase domain-containing protein [Rhodothermales bacterium]